MPDPKITPLALVKTEDNSDVPITTLPEFLAWVRSAGLQKTNRFFVDIEIPPKVLMSSIEDRGVGGIGTKKHDVLLACEEINMPPRSIQTRTLRLGGLNERRASTIDYGGDFTLSFLVDSTHEVQDFIERWMNLAVNQKTREVSEYRDYARSVSLYFLRPFSPNEVYQPLSRIQNSPNKFLNTAKNRILNLAAAEVGKFKTRLKQSIETKKQVALGSNLGVYNRIKGLIPLELLARGEDAPSDYIMYKIRFDEAFPVQITRSVMSHGGTDVLRISVQFAFKEYTTRSTDVMTADKDDNFVLNFVKRMGLPTSKSSIAQAAINLL